MQHGSTNEYTCRNERSTSGINLNTVKQWTSRDTTLYFAPPPPPRGKKASSTPVNRNSGLARDQLTFLLFHSTFDLRDCLQSTGQGTVMSKNQRSIVRA